MIALTPIPTPNAGFTTTVVGSPGSAFVPAAGLIGWYIPGDDGYVDGEETLAWQDYSGQGHTLDANGPNIALLDTGGAFPVARWTGAETNYLETPSALFSAGQDRSIVIVYQSDDDLADYDICGQGDGGGGGGIGFWLQNQSGVDPSLTTGGAPVGSAAVFSTAYKWAVAKYSAGDLVLTDSTATGNSTQAVADASVRFCVGKVAGTYSAATFKGSIAELLVYDHALTTDEQTALVAYLVAKYSL